jgi:tRNA(Ser,Leu) C12 N-acetylase TAN1
VTVGDDSEALDARLAAEEGDTVATMPEAHASARRPLRPARNNVVVTVRDHDDYAYVEETLRNFGEVERTSFFNVLLLRVDEPEMFCEALASALVADRRLAGALGHAAPATHTFQFESTDEFEAATIAIARELADDVADASFHVRVHRRGGPSDLAAPDEESLIADTLLEALPAIGSSGVVTFDDPDVVVDVQTVGHWAGVGLRTRDDLRAFPFLET